MKRLKIVCIALALSLLWVPCLFGSDLSQAAKKERERRAKLKAQSEEVVTNADLKRILGGILNLANSQGASNAPGENEAKKKDLLLPKDLTPEQLDKIPAEVKKRQREMGEYLDQNGNGESYWRAKIANQKKQIAGLEQKKSQLELKIPALRTAFINTDDPAQKLQRKQEMDNSMRELDQVKNSIASAQSNLNQIREDGRKARALPGWLN